MKNLLKTSLLGVATLAAANVASAQVTVSQSNPTVLNSAINGALQAFIVTIDADEAGKVITGINITLSDTDGSIHSVQGFDDPGTTPSPFEDSSQLNTAARRDVDTHLLFNGDELLSAGADATEQVDPALTTANDGTRVQRFLNGANALTSGNQGIVAGAQVDPLPLIYVVLKPGETASLQGQVALSGETSPRQFGPFTVGIPEPTCL